MAGRIRYLTQNELKKAIDNLINGLTDEEESLVESSSDEESSGTLYIIFIFIFIQIYLTRYKLNTIICCFWSIIASIVRNMNSIISVVD